MNAEFNLWPVGQGLFYSGLFYSGLFYSGLFYGYKLIYDCGGSNERQVKSAIESYVEKYSDPEGFLKIDMLIISHFDSDHINGLPCLIEKCSVIDKIYIPYYGGIESYLLLVAYIYGYGENFSNKVKEIVAVNTPETNNEIGRFGEESNMEKYKIHEVVYRKVNEQEISDIEKQISWKFKFYNRVIDGKSNVKAEIDKLIQNIECKNKTLEGILTEKPEEARAGLRRIYDSYCQRSSGDKSKQNQSSLCLYHSPSVRDRYVSFYSYNTYYFRKRILLLMGDESLTVSGNRDCFGTLLTGDISLKTKSEYTEFLNHYRQEIVKTRFFLVPHHGSDKNWNNSIINDYHGISIFLCSAGIKNNYHHPNEGVLRDICHSGKILRCANENVMVSYSIC